MDREKLLRHDILILRNKATILRRPELLVEAALLEAKLELVTAGRRFRMDAPPVARPTGRRLVARKAVA